MKIKTIITIVFITISLLSFSQITKDSLVGTYVGKYWFKWQEDTAWTIKADTAYILSIDTGCYMHFISPNDYGYSDYETLYNFCNGNKSNNYDKFYSEDSIAIVSDNISMPPPNYHLWSQRFYGKKISSKILSINTITVNTDITIFPNPFSDFIYLKNIHNAIIVQIIDLSGKIVLSKDIRNKDELQIITSQLTKGFYVLQITYTTFIKSFKVFKE